MCYSKLWLIATKTIDQSTAFRMTFNMVAAFNVWCIFLTLLHTYMHMNMYVRRINDRTEVEMSSGITNTAFSILVINYVPSRPTDTSVRSLTDTSVVDNTLI